MLIDIAKKAIVTNSEVSTVRVTSHEITTAIVDYMKNDYKVQEINTNNPNVIITANKKMKDLDLRYYGGFAKCNFIMLIDDNEIKFIEILKIPGYIYGHTYSPKVLATFIYVKQ
jgi:hypothetical protein